MFLCPLMINKVTLQFFVSKQFNHPHSCFFSRLFCPFRSPFWLAWHIGHSTHLDPLIRNEYVSINKKKLFFKKAAPLFSGVPQGSVLWPLLFTLYATLLISLIHSNKFDHHLYADDTQVYVSLSTTETDLSLKRPGYNFSKISGWMIQNRLRLNANKADFVIIGTSKQRSKLTRFLPTPILNHTTTPSDGTDEYCYFTSNLAHYTW